MRRASKLDDSFDMFLDTITNTFGGVLLITLLIVLMVQQTSEARQSAVEQDAALPNRTLVNSQMEALVAEKQLLTQSNKASVGFFDGFVSSEKEESLSKLVVQQGRNQRLNQSLEELNAGLTELSARATQMKNQRISQAALLASKEKLADDLAQQLEDLKAGMVRTIPLPKEKSSSKSGRTFFLQDGDLFQFRSSSGRIYRDHFVECAESEADYSHQGESYRVRNGRGISLSNKQLDQTFNQFNSKRSYLTFVVRPDAFEDFANVRQQAVAAGFEYRIIATEGVISSGAGSVKTQ